MLYVTPRQYLKFSVIYALLAGAVASVVHPRGIDFVLAMFMTPKFHFSNLWLKMPLICAAVVVAGFLTRALLDMATIRRVFVVFMGTVFFMAGFSVSKSLMPFIVPFWADPMLADLDRALHFGVDPWRLVEPLRALLGTDIIDTVYFTLWAWIGVAGPLLVALFDRDPVRLGRFLALFMFSWIFLGNILAMSFMSGGPVYMDRLFGTEAFTELVQILSSETERASRVGIVREWLWHVNQDSYRGISSGISAFPSLHVAIAALGFFYLFERSILLGLLGFAYLIAIQIGSVLSGFHYALDGYVSFIVVGCAWALTRRAMPRPLPHAHQDQSPQAA